MHHIALILAIAIIAAGCKDRKPPEPSSPDPELAALFTSFAPNAYRLEDKKPGRFSTKYVFADGDHSIRLEVFEKMDAETATQLQEDGIMGVEALYADALSPYPGDISRKIVKDRKFSPKLVRKDDRAYYLLYANERFGYGASTGEAVKYVSLFGWLHCAESERFFKIRLFAPAKSSDLAKLEKLFASLECAGASAE